MSGDTVRTVTLPTGEEITMYWAQGLGRWVTIPDDDNDDQEAGE